jgi:hypothetical protein
MTALGQQRPIFRLEDNSCTCQRIIVLIFSVFASGADRCGRTLPSARRNHASKIYHAEAPARPGIGSDIGNADRTPIIARHPDTTNKAIFGARIIKLSPIVGSVAFQMAVKLCSAAPRL